jgi:primosomal protein N' (replication factor Y) (superfamily II helicase)
LSLGLPSLGLASLGQSVRFRIDDTNVTGRSDNLVVTVLPDVKGFDKRFDYLVPAPMAERVRVGTIVRVDLAGRRVRGWVTVVGTEPPAGVKLRPITKVTGWGPPGDLIELAEWAAWRWAGRPQHMLTTASPEGAVGALPAARKSANLPVASAAWMDRVFDSGGSVVRLAPAADPFDIALAACRLGNALIVCPTLGMARRLGARLRRSGAAICLYPRDWAQGAAGCSVIGTRAAVWAPVAGLAAIVVIDEHDESLQQERSPTWHARDVALERATRAGVPCVLTSPHPTLEALDARRVVAPSRSDERAGWAALEIADRSDEDPATRSSPIGPALMRALQSDKRVVCVLNTKGVARLLSCGSCKDLVRCERCEAAVEQVGEDLVCRRCDAKRPVVCTMCGGSRMKAVRRGVSRVRDELAAAVNADVAEVTGESDENDVALTRVVVGTEAVLHRVAEADVVAFIEFDTELLAPRYRADEHSLALLSRASRLVGGRSGRVIVQTTQSEHPVLRAALIADPALLERPARDLRMMLRLPPVSAFAAISGPGASELVARLRIRPGIDTTSSETGGFLVRCADSRSLADALEAVDRPAERVRIAVDPHRI